MHPNTFLTALVVWREASNQLPVARRGVACVIKNRVTRPGWWGRTLLDVVSKPAQFTSMVPPSKAGEHPWDPNLVRYPAPDDQSWLNCVAIADDVWSNDGGDPTNGATFYYDKSMDKAPPAWAATYKHTVDLGDIHFFSDK